MKKYYFITLLSLIPILVYSQIATMNQTINFEKISSYTRMRIYKDVNNNIIIQAFDPSSDFGNLHYNDNSNCGNLNLCFINPSNQTVKFQFQKFNKSDYKLNQTFEIGKKIVALFDMYDKKTEMYIVGYSIIDESKMENLKPQELFSFPVKQKSEPNLTLLVSEDKSHFALINKVIEPKEEPLLYCAVFDNDFKLVWSQNKIKIKPKYTEYSLDNMILGNDKTIYTYFESYTKENGLIVSLESSIISIYGNVQDKEIMEYERLLPSQIKIIQRDNEIVIVGYLLSEVQDGYKGLFSCMYNTKNKSFSNFNQKIFSQKFINETNFNIERKDGTPLTMRSFKINNILPQTDGSIMVFGEESWDEMIKYNSSSGSYIQFSYRYYCIIYSKINKSGDFEWVKLIPRRQKTNGYSGSFNSFAIHQNDKYIYLFYNDNIDNISTNIKEYKDTKWRKYCIHCVKIDTETGSYSKQFLLNTKNKKTWLFRNIVALSPEKIAFIGMNFRGKSLNIIDLK